MESKRMLLIFLTASVCSFPGAELFELENEAERFDNIVADLAEPLQYHHHNWRRNHFNVTTAGASLRGASGVYGGVTFVTFMNTMYIQGFIANLTDGPHGLHIHASGVVSNNCNNIGNIYNPFNGSHSCSPATGYLGDFGNIIAQNGYAYVNMTVSQMTLKWSNGTQGNGNPGVLGLSIAVDANADTCQPTNDGSSGPPVACGIILPLFGPPIPPPFLRPPTTTIKP